MLDFGYLMSIYDFIPLPIAIALIIVLILFNRKFKKLTPGECVFWSFVILILVEFVWLS